MFTVLLLIIFSVFPPTLLPLTSLLSSHLSRLDHSSTLIPQLHDLQFFSQDLSRSLPVLIAGASGLTFYYETSGKVF